ncbi:MAG: recombinase family protein, partial [Defluviitaleaceae bacterium]|nr:recombinase family protein [Defluviitaleaceae bacterium]
KTRIGEYESLTASHELSDIEFDLIRQMLTSFKDTIDNMDVEQKRAALRTFIKKIVWDGENVHLYLFGSDTTKGIEMPTHEEISEGLKKGNVEGTLCEDSK